MKAVVGPVALGALLLTGCVVEPDTSPSDVTPSDVATPETWTVVATTTVLGSITEQIGRCAGNTDVEVLMPLGIDPHDYQPSSAQLATVADAGFVVANGLFLEESLVEPLEELEAQGGIVFRMGEVIDPLPFGGHDDSDDHGEDHASDDGHDRGHDDEHSGEDNAEDSHAHGSEDPHFWMDMNRVADGTEVLGRELAEQFGAEFAACGEEVAASIRAAEQEVVGVLEAIPDDRRILVTDHDALGYFAERYGFTVAGVVIPGGSTLAEASSQDLAELVQRIEGLGLEAMFGNFHVPSDLLDAVAEESGGIEVVPLYIGSIGQPGSEQESYQAMMLYDARQIARALGN